jgi:hypothetical protein
MVLYDAFISYSHARDKPVAAALQRALQRLGKPWYRRRALRVFRDDTSLSATPHLWPSIETALSRSRFLILLASPEAGASPWVEKELAYWLAHKGTDTLLIAVTDGELAWDAAAAGFPAGAPLPAILRDRLVHEPRWIDLRAYRDGGTRSDTRFTERAAEFAATIHGIAKEDLLSLERQHQRRALALALSAAGALLVLAVGAAWEWRDAVAQRIVAETNQRAALEQRDRALLVESRLLTDEAKQQRAEGDMVSAMLLSMEALPDPDEANPLHGRPFFPEAQRAFYEAMEARTELAVSAVGGGELVAAHLDPDRECVFRKDANRLVSICRRLGQTRVERSFGDAGETILAVSRAPLRVATLGTDHVMRLWDFDRSTQLAAMPAAAGDLKEAILSGDGNRLLARYAVDDFHKSQTRTTIELIDLSLGQTKTLALDLGDTVQAMTFSDDGDDYAVLTDRSLSVCRTPTECESVPMTVAVDRKAGSMHFRQATGAFAILLNYGPSTDEASRLEPGQHFVSERGEADYARNDFSILLLRKRRDAPFETIEPDRTASVKDDITGVNIASSGKEAFVAHLNGTVDILALDGKGADRRVVLRGHVGAIAQVAFNPERREFVTFGRDDTLRVWSEVPTFSWNFGLELDQAEINPTDDPDFHIRTDILAEIETDKKDQFLKRIEELLKSPDFERITAARRDLPRCLHPVQRRLLSLSPAPPQWCLDLAKWPFDTPDWKQRLALSQPSLP